MNKWLATLGDAKIIRDVRSKAVNGTLSVDESQILLTLYSFEMRKNTQKATMDKAEMVLSDTLPPELMVHILKFVQLRKRQIVARNTYLRKIIFSICDRCGIAWRYQPSYKNMVYIGLTDADLPPRNVVH